MLMMDAKLGYSRGIDGHSNRHGRHASPCSHLHVPANRLEDSVQEMNSLGSYQAMPEAQVEAEFAVQVCKLKRR